MSTNRHGRLMWAGLAVLVAAISAALVLLLSTLFGRHTANNPQPQPVPSPPMTTTVAAAPAPPTTATLTVAPAPTSQAAARVVGPLHDLQLQGTPDDWDVIVGELHKLGIDVQINVIGVITHLEFANYDKAPDNWVRWHTAHVPTEPFHPDPSMPSGAFLAGMRGLPVPPPPKICYTDDGTPVPIERFPGPYIHCGQTPGAVAGH